jgi:predicted aminopeptidase
MLTGKVQKNAAGRPCTAGKTAESGAGEKARSAADKTVASTAGGAVRCALTVAVLAALSGCAGTMYLLQAGRGEWHVMHDRKPIVQVIDDPRTPQPMILELADVREARAFASRVLKLPDNASYTTYTRIDRPYVVWNVVAAPALSIYPKTWCFPIAGCVAYRGYFSEKSARDFAAQLKRRGYDVVVEGVPAYSTLGKLPDPVMSTMMRYGSDELAAMIFHELAHQQLYVADDSKFNEAFAVTVEQEGLKRWLDYKGRPMRIEELDRQREEDGAFMAVLRYTRARLARLYASAAPRRTKLRRKREIFADLAADIHTLERRLHVHSPIYDDWITEGLNNAQLASVSTYYDCVPGFERLLRRENGDLPRFYAAARELAREPKAARDDQLCSQPLTTNAADPVGQTRPADRHNRASARSP